MDVDRQLSLAVSTVIFALRPHPISGRSVVSLPLMRRTREPFAERWALPGGWADPAEGLEQTAARNLVETTGVRPGYLEQLYCFGAPERSPSGRVVSVVYWALVAPEQTDADREADNVRWFAADELPELAFDHNLIVEYALWRLRNKLEYSQIAHALLGETFTLGPGKKFTTYEAGAGPTGPGRDRAVFRRLVLGWINADFRVQGRIF